MLVTELEEPRLTDEDILAGLADCFRTEAAAAIRERRLEVLAARHGCWMTLAMRVTDAYPPSVI